MRKIINLLLLLCLSYVGIAQQADPAVTGANFVPQTINVGGQSVLTVSFANTSAFIIPANSIELTVSMPVSCYSTNGVTPPTGPGAAFFTWTYNNNTWRGINSATVLAFDGGNVLFNVTGNSACPNPQTTNVNVQPVASFGSFLDSPTNNNLQPGLPVLAPVPVCPTPAILGAVAGCNGSTIELRVDTFSVANSYSWSVTGGARTVPGPNGTVSVTLPISGNGPFTVSLVESGAEICAAGNASAVINLSALAACDVDGDGVINALDLCPETPPRTSVDATGCPNDADGDGVLNGLDNCPNTPLGTRVDENGCPLPVCPTPEIAGSLVGCKGSSVSLKVDTLVTGNTYTWAITGGATVVPGPNGTVTVQLPATGNGPFNLTLTETNAARCAVSATVAISASVNLALTCDTDVNISVGDNCRNELTASTLLEGTIQGDDAYDIVVKDLQGRIVPANLINSGYINQKLVFSVTSKCDGNSCWGNLIFEDKIAPKITCPTKPDTVFCYQTTLTFTNPAATDNCGGSVPVTVLSNNLNELPCQNGSNIAAIRTIVYSAKDQVGNVSENCTRKIYYKSFAVDSIVFPKNRDGLQGQLPYFTCDETKWDLNNNYYPDPIESGFPTINGVQLGTTNGYCKINMTFTDDTIKICTKSYKLIRNWTILDWCTGGIKTHSQIIKVLDDRGPIVTCDPDFRPTSQTRPYDCLGDIKLPKPVVAFDCSKWDYKIQYLLADVNGLPPVNGKFIETNVVRNTDSTYTIKDLPKGLTWIKYIVTDECGNVTECGTEVFVRDNTAPVAICQEFTVASVVNTGVAQINATSFNDGSYDNCGKVAFEAARMVAGCGYGTTFGPNVGFCCAEIGTEQMVQLRVWDDANCNGILGDEINVYNDANENGILGDEINVFVNGDSIKIADRLIGKIRDNSNTCMVRVKIQDKANPIITCPADITIDCSAQTDTAYTGVARAVDNCSGVKVTMDEQRNVNQCWAGTITRTFTATDASGNKASCRQIVTLEDKTPFRERDINWSAVSNKELTICNTEANISPDRLGRPTWTNNECSTVAAEYKDQQFNIIDSVCVKILRTWTVIDWCTFRADQPNAGGKYSYIQVIKFNNTTKPKFNACRDTTVCIDGPSCDGNVTLSQIADDDCTRPADMSYIYTIDRKDDGSVELFGGGATFTKLLQPDVYRVKVTAKDGCGNEELCSYKVTVKDCKKPTPYCYSDLVTVVMNNTSKNVSIWARDFDKGSTDNCAGPLRFSFTESVRDTGLTFTCATRGIQRLKMYVHDTTGNRDFCEVRVDIQANDGICGAGSTINGRITYIDNKPISEVAITYTEANSSEYKIGRTNSEGKFDFFTGGTPSSITLEPDYNLDLLRGVSTLDLVHIQRHILGIARLDSPYKLIAADINKSANINVTDLVALRKAILGVTNSFPNNESFVFVSKDATFSDPEKPYDFSQKIVGSLDPSRFYDFMAVKIGDVNNSASAANARLLATPRSVYSVKVEKALDKNGEEIINFKASDDYKTVGFQTSIDFNADLTGMKLIPRAFKMENEFANVSEASSGLISFSYASTDVINIKKDQILFSMKADKLKDVSIDEVKVTKTHVASEIYDESFGITSLIVDPLQIIGRPEGLGFTVSQNAPNPFSQTTTFDIEIPADADITWYVTDITGRRLMEQKASYKAGKHAITINSTDLKTTGIMTYTVETPFGTASKKMVLSN
jgi:hypothetical protein